MSIGERILELRKNQNISQTEMAKAMDVSRQAVSKWESDKSSPDTLKLIQLAEYLNTEVEYLATGRHPEYKSPDIHVTLVNKPEKVVEKIVEKPVERIVERVIKVPVEVPAERPAQKPSKARRVRIRYKYIRNPVELMMTGLGGLVIGLLIGLAF